VKHCDYCDTESECAKAEKCLSNIHDEPFEGEIPLPGFIMSESVRGGPTVR
jgi:hypothetical protein